MFSHTFTLPDGTRHVVTPRNAADDEAIDQALFARNAYDEATVDQVREIHEETASVLGPEAAAEMGLIAEAIAAGGFSANGICRVQGTDLDARAPVPDEVTLTLPAHAVRLIARLAAEERKRLLAAEDGPSLAGSAAWDSLEAIESALPDESTRDASA